MNGMLGQKPRYLQLFLIFAKKRGFVCTFHAEFHDSLGWKPQPTYLPFGTKIKSFKPRLSDTLRLDEREVCLSIPKLPEAKLRRVMRRSLKPEKANGVRSEAG